MNLTLSEPPKILNVTSRPWGVIRKTEIFQNAPEEFLSEISRMLERKYIRANTTIFNQGDEGGCMYFIEQGAAQVLVNGVQVATLVAGASVGEMALVSGERRGATVITVGYCVLQRLNKEDFEFLRMEYPAFDQLVRAVIAHKNLVRNGQASLCLEKTLIWSRLLR